MNEWRQYALNAVQDAETARRFVSPEAAGEILRSAAYVLEHFTSPPGPEPPRQYPSKFVVVRSD